MLALDAPLDGIGTFFLLVFAHVFQHLFECSDAVYAFGLMVQEALIMTWVDCNQVQCHMVVVLFEVVDHTVGAHSDVVADFRLEVGEFDVFVYRHGSCYERVKVRNEQGWKSTCEVARFPQSHQENYADQGLLFCPLSLGVSGPCNRSLPQLL